MIPREIEARHIEQAAQEIDIKGVPTKRKSKKYFVEIGNSLYPPKYVVSIAMKCLSGKELDPGDFIATEARLFLNNRGYKILKKQDVEYS